MCHLELLGLISIKENLQIESTSPPYQLNSLPPLPPNHHPTTQELDQVITITKTSIHDLFLPKRSIRRPSFQQA
jgi:hypothetical protein